MNKKIKNSLLLLVLAIVTPVCIFGAIYTYDAVVTIGIPTVIITHTQPVQVPPVNKELVVVGTVTFSDSGSLSQLKCIYTLEGSSATESDIETIVPISATSYRFSKSITIEQNGGNISYQFTASGQVGSVSVSTITTVYITTVTATASQSVDPLNPVPVVLESGNQTAGNTSIVFVSGSFTGIQNIIITQLDPSNPPAFADTNFGANRASETDSFVALYLIEPEGLEVNPKATLTLYFGNANPSKLFMKFRESNGKWITITDNVVIDATMKTISARISKLGYYAVSTQGSMPDTDYRPVKRVVIMNQGTFKFENMTDGDKLKIFNINGKKVREITSRGTYPSGFEWDGRKDDGGWAESGTYIYQLNIQGKDKLISGTIAFVK
ncbi:MAG: hypothetical protein PHR82_07255 [Endomicrobiaceae bacterium]|nr:hypothetical protein [Endomicrobiaceae bacterium]